MTIKAKEQNKFDGSECTTRQFSMGTMRVNASPGLLQLSLIVSLGNHILQGKFNS